MTSHSPAADAATDYQHCVDREREAWAAMHGHQPGSEARGDAFHAWSEAIARTNQAWRRLRAQQRARPGMQPQHDHG